MRFLSLFSCGAASAVATKLALDENALNYNEYFEILYTEVAEEHPDNKRFLKECELWFDKKITIARNELYNASIYEVFIKQGRIVTPWGAPCTKYLKKQVRQRRQRIGDTIILGFTYEEQSRMDRFIDANNEVDVWCPLIDHKLTKKDVLGILEEQMIELPTMYKLGYKNNNCIGCVKGGQGYWNKIRKDFPETFARMAKLEKDMENKILSRVKNKKKEYFYLDDLVAGAGTYKTEPDIECGVVCMSAIDLLDESVAEI